MRNIEKINFKFYFFQYLKNSNNIPSISKTIQHTPMTWCTYLQSFEKIHQCVFELQCEQTDALQYLPSRAFGAAGDNKTYADLYIPRIVSTNLMVAHYHHAHSSSLADHCRCTKHPDISFFAAPYVSTMVIQYPISNTFDLWSSLIVSLLCLQ